MNGLANYSKLTKTADVELLRHCFYHQICICVLLGVSSLVSSNPSLLVG